jgi:hypothetical protein
MTGLNFALLLLVFVCGMSFCFIASAHTRLVRKYRMQEAVIATLVDHEIGTSTEEAYREELRCLNRNMQWYCRAVSLYRGEIDEPPPQW